RKSTATTPRTPSSTSAAPPITSNRRTRPGSGWRPFSRRSCKEPAERPVDLVGPLLRDEMAAVDGVAGHRLGVVAPHRQQVVAAALAAAAAPQDQQRRRDLDVPVGAVVFEVDRGAGAVLVAGGADRLGVGKAAQILGIGLGLVRPGPAREAE